MTDRIHPAVQAMQATARQTVLDRVRAQAERPEPAVRDDPVLTTCQPRDEQVGWVTVLRHDGG